MTKNLSRNSQVCQQWNHRSKTKNMENNIKELFHGNGWEQIMIWFNKIKIYYLRNKIPGIKKTTGSSRVHVEVLENNATHEARLRTRSVQNYPQYWEISPTVYYLYRNWNW